MKKLLLLLVLLQSLVYAEVKKILIISTPMGASTQSSKMQYVKNIALKTQHPPSKDGGLV